MALGASRGRVLFRHLLPATTGLSADAVRAAAARVHPRRGDAVVCRASGSPTISPAGARCSTKPRTSACCRARPGCSRRRSRSSRWCWPSTSSPIRPPRRLTPPPRSPRVARWPFTCGACMPRWSRRSAATTSICRPRAQPRSLRPHPAGGRRRPRLEQRSAAARRRRERSGARGRAARGSAARSCSSRAPAASRRAPRSPPRRGRPPPGADAVIVRTPSFFRAQMRADHFVRHYEAVADASPVPGAAVQRDGLHRRDPAGRRLRAAGARTRTSSASRNPGPTSSCSASTSRRRRDGFAVLGGAHATLYAAVCIGARGGVLAVAGVIPDLCAELFELADAGRHRGGARAAAAPGPVLRPRRRRASAWPG